MAAKEKKGNVIDRLAGDKVVWIIMLSLCLISFVSIFSSTSQMATRQVSRLNIVYDQIKTILGGLVIVLFCCYCINKVRTFKWISILCFPLSVMLLVFLDAGIHTSFVSSATINTVRRVLVVGGFQIHVFEVVKVAMVLYVAWAVDALRHGDLKLLDSLSDRFNFLRKDFWREMVMIFLPIIMVCVLVLPGGNSSALFLACILVATVLVAGIDFKHILVLGLCGIAVFLCCFGIYKASGGTVFEHIGTAVSRFSDESTDYETIFLQAKTNEEKYKAADKIRQPYGAKMAIKEGGVFGKGPGASTQKYVVPIIYGDYIYSFIVEEYGIFGGLIVLLLYISLVARGSIIVRNCEDEFAKIAIAGLCLLIAGQGLFHILINCDVGILTGQTLPLVSHGTSSFWCFSAAFGVILSLSRIASRKVEKETQAAKPLVDTTLRDDINEGLDILSNS